MLPGNKFAPTLPLSFQVCIIAVAVSYPQSISKYLHSDSLALSVLNNKYDPQFHKLWALKFVSQHQQKHASSYLHLHNAVAPHSRMTNAQSTSVCVRWNTGTLLKNMQSFTCLVFNFTSNLGHYLEQLNCAYSYISFFL